MMKHILIIWFCLLNMYPYALYAEDANAQQYQDSILKIAQSMPGTLPKLTYLRDMAYRHQYAPYNKTFSTALYQEACIQKNIIYENLGAYYLASCYDKLHDADSLAYWVDKLEKYAPEVGTSLRVDILSRIAQVYGNTGRDSLRRPYVQQMDEALQEVITREPETRKNWSNFEIDCQIKYVLLYMNKGTYHIALEHINKAKALLEDHVYPVFWLNVQLVQLQYYASTQ